MSKKNDTPNPDYTQLSLFDLFAAQNAVEDDRPLPLIVADKWRFPLTHIDRDYIPANYIYLAVDWYLGLGGKKSTWSLSKNDWFGHIKPVMIEVKRTRRKPEIMEFVDANGLYFIAAQMTARDDRPQLDEIKAYLAHAGQKLDEYRLNPDQAAFEQGQRADNRYTKRLQEHGYTNEQIPALLEQRKIDIQVRNNFTNMLRDNVENPQYGAITNTEYRMFRRDANQMSMQLDTKQVREAMHPIAKNFCQIAELTCIEKVRQLGRKLTNLEANNIMYNIAMGLQTNVDWIQRELGMDVVTGQPLIPKWNKDVNHD